MNLVLADTEEFRRTRRRGKAAPGATQQVTETEERRAIGLTIIRGAHVISLSVDGPPPADPAARLGAAASGPTTAATLAAGPGVARPAGRGLPVGLTGPAPGAGGSGPGFGGGFPGAPAFGGPPGFPGRGGPPGGGPRTSHQFQPSKHVLTFHSRFPSTRRTPWWLRRSPRIWWPTTWFPRSRWTSWFWWQVEDIVIAGNCDIISNDMELESNTLQKIELRSSKHATPTCMRDEGSAQSLGDKLVARKAATETDSRGRLFIRAFGVFSSGNPKKHLAQLLPWKDICMDGSRAIPLSLICNYRNAHQP
jgi:hypothetical protein